MLQSHFMHPIVPQAFYKKSKKVRFCFGLFFFNNRNSLWLNFYNVENKGRWYPVVVTEWLGSMIKVWMVKESGG